MVHVLLKSANNQVRRLSLGSIASFRNSDVPARITSQRRDIPSVSSSVSSFYCMYKT